MCQWEVPGAVPLPVWDVVPWTSHACSIEPSFSTNLKVEHNYQCVITAWELWLLPCGENRVSGKPGRTEICPNSGPVLIDFQQTALEGETKGNKKTWRNRVRIYHSSAFCPQSCAEFEILMKGKVTGPEPGAGLTSTFLETSCFLLLGGEPEPLIFRTECSGTPRAAFLAQFHIDKAVQWLSICLSLKFILSSYVAPHK